MISIEMTVREAMGLAINANNEMYERIVQALEAKCGELRSVMTLRSVPRDNFIPCIKILRSHLGWGLKDAKDWLDVVRGRWSSYDSAYVDGVSNTLAHQSDVIVKIASELRAQGCVVEVTNV
jgi:ribosomal protein L7/L12